MKNITVYDDTAARLEKLAEKMETTTAELIDVLLDNGDDIINDFFAPFATWQNR